MAKKKAKAGGSKRGKASPTARKTDGALRAIEADLVRSIRAFAIDLPHSVQLGGASEASRESLVAKCDAWLTENGIV